MSLYNLFCRKIVLPVSDLVLNKSLSTNIHFLEESQWWDHVKIKEFQHRKLQEIVRFAYREIPFYNNLMKLHGISPGDIETEDDLKKLPILKKDDIREIYNSKNRAGKHSIKMASSGSTGEPLQYSVNPEAFSMHYAAAIRGWQWMGYSLGDRYMKVSQHPRMKMLKKFQDLVLRSSFFYLKDISDKEFEKLKSAIEQFKPEYFRSYPDPLMFFMRFLNDREYPVPEFKGINTTGNILYPEARQKIERRFKTKIYDHYRCEGSSMFCQSGEGEFYYGSDEYAITEILDEHGKDTSAGEKGRLVTTDLWNTEVPFIRYDTQDIVTRSSVDKSNKRSLTSIDRIDGRDCDILITPDNRILIVHNFTIFFERFTSIDQFKVIQAEINHLHILLKVKESFKKETVSEIRKYWSEIFGGSAAIHVNVVDSIPSEKSGKRRFLERNPSIEIPF